MVLHPDGRVEGTPQELAQYAYECGRLTATPRATDVSPVPVPAPMPVPAPVPYPTFRDPPPGVLVGDYPPTTHPIWMGVVPPPGATMPRITC